MNITIKKRFYRFLYNINLEKISKKIAQILSTQQFILFENIKNQERDNICKCIVLLKLIDNNYCELCENYGDYFGYCIEHYDQVLIDKYRREFNEIIHNDEVKRINFMHYYVEYKLKIRKLINNLIKIKNEYFNVTYKTFNFSHQYHNIDKNINKNNLHRKNTLFEDNKSYEIIKNFKNNNKCEENIINLLVFLLKKYIYDEYLLIDILKDSKSITTTTYIGNNNILYNKICKSNIIDQIEYIETEKSIKINNHTLRFDIYMIVKIFNIEDDYTTNYYELVIETDEQHHHTINSNTIEYDILKDEYCFNNGISLLRLELKNRKIIENDINFALFFIKYLIIHHKPIYYFSDKYINNHRTYDKTCDNIDKKSFIIGSNIKIFKINEFNNVNDIKNINKYIKSIHLTNIIDKFAINNTLL
jgi:hypothetical protein